MSRRRLPPHGRRVARVLRQPRELARHVGCTDTRGSVWIATGPRAWDWAQARPRHLVVVLPLGDDPHQYDWRFLAGHEPILIVGPDAHAVDRRRRIASALLRDGVLRSLADTVLMVGVAA